MTLAEVPTSQLWAAAQHFGARGIGASGAESLIDQAMGAATWVITAPQIPADYAREVLKNAAAQLLQAQQQSLAEGSLELANISGELASRVSKAALEVGRGFGMAVQEFLGLKPAHLGLLVAVGAVGGLVALAYSPIGPALAPALLKLL